MNRDSVLPHRLEDLLVLGGHPGHDRDVRSDARGRQSPAQYGTAGGHARRAQEGSASSKHTCPMNARSAVVSDAVASPPRWIFLRTHPYAFTAPAETPDRIHRCATR
jgi:hypothetical protein